MLCRVARIRTDVSEESIASIIRVTRIGELGTLAVIRNNSSPISVTPVVVLTIAHAVTSQKTAILHSRRRENLKSYIALTG
jgi:hypothetical protein